MENKSNIPKELHTAPAQPLKVEPQDADTAEAVNEFIRQKSAEAEGNPIPEEDPTQVPIEKRPTEVPPNTEFSEINPQDAAISDALATDNNVPITDMEREVFLKAVLNDEPVRLSVSLYDGKLTVELRSRTTFEQRRIFDVVDADRKEEIIDRDNMALMVTRMQYYLAAIMIERVNGESFSELKLDPKEEMAVHKKALREKVREKLEGMVAVRWNSLATAIRTFENKCAKMNTEALNENFWKPQGSV